MQQRSDCTVCRDVKTVAQILEDLLGAYADAGRLDLQLTEDCPELEYTAQYRESDLGFGRRMMERHGISYHFEHSAGGHNMVLSDDVTSQPGIGALPYKPHTGHHQRSIGHIRAWRPARRITTGAIRLTDYSFKTSDAVMEVDRTGDAGHAHGQIESRDYPGEYLESGRGRLVADLRTRAERGQSERFEAEVDVVSLRPGVRMTLEGDPGPGSRGRVSLPRRLAQVPVERLPVRRDGRHGGRLRGPLPADARRPPDGARAQDAPALVHGPQTGVVVGEGEIDCDEHGRILVHLHWDIDCAYTMSCRVAQSWASKGWGGMVIPRIGMEVVVGQSFQQTVGKAMSTIVRGRWESDAGQVQVMRVGDQITIKAGEKSMFTMSKKGVIVLKGTHIRLGADKIDLN